MVGLQRSRHLARQNHWCDTCCSDILPGELYERLVLFYKSPKRILVLKQHIFPACEPPEEPDFQEEATISRAA